MMGTFDFVYRRLLAAGYTGSLAGFDNSGNFHYENIEQFSKHYFTVLNYIVNNGNDNLLLDDMLEVFRRINNHDAQNDDLIKARWFIKNYHLSDFVRTVIPNDFDNFKEMIDSCSYEELKTLVQDFHDQYGDDEKINVMVAYINANLDVLAAKKENMRFVLGEEDRRGMQIESDVLAIESAKAKNLTRIKSSKPIQ